MKYIHLALALFLTIGHLYANETQFEYELPEGAEYKLQPAGNKKLHIFRLEEHKADPTYFGLDLASLVLIEIDKPKFEGLIEHFKGKTKEEIEAEFREGFLNDPSSPPLHSIAYKKITLGQFKGHRIKIKTESVEAKKGFILLSNFLEGDGSYWLANGMTLRDEADILTVDEILKSIRLSKDQVQPDGRLNSVTRSALH